MKQKLLTMLGFLLIFSLAACTAPSEPTSAAPSLMVTPDAETSVTESTEISGSTPEPTAPPAAESSEIQLENEPVLEEDTPVSKTLVVYFSATGTTRPLAEYAADILSAELYEITPSEPYTDADLAYYTGGRADQEQDDPDARPAINGSVDGMEDYDTIILGYPIWHGQAPRIISTFLESYDFTGKTILPFCTSHSSGIGSSDANLHSLAEGANWLPGQRFPAGTSREDIEDWLTGSIAH